MTAGSPVGVYRVYLRGLKGYTQRELADASGVPRTTIQQAEDGEDVHVKHVRSLARALGVTTAEFLDPPADWRKG